MHPILISVDTLGRSVEISSYRFFLAVAVVVVLGAGLIIAIRRGFPAGKVVAVLSAGAAASLAGARVFHAATHLALYGHDQARLFALTTTGFSLYGGLVAAAFSVAIACRLCRLKFWRLADSLIPALGFGIAIARIGCFLNGCCFGKETFLPWGVVFPKGSAPYLYAVGTSTDKTIGAFGFGGLSLGNFTPHPVHPTQLYELAAALVFSGFAIWILTRRTPDGFATLAFAASFSLFRWLNSGLRVTPLTYTMPTWFDTLLYGLIISGCLIVLALRANVALELWEGMVPKSSKYALALAWRESSAECVRR